LPNELPQNFRTRAGPESFPDEYKNTNKTGNATREDKWVIITSHQKDETPCRHVHVVNKHGKLAAQWRAVEALANER
jgi:hypothetical protein